MSDPNIMSGNQEFKHKSIFVGVISDDVTVLFVPFGFLIIKTSQFAENLPLLNICNFSPIHTI